MVAASRFRADLYYRLHVFPVRSTIAGPTGGHRAAHALLRPACPAHGSQHRYDSRVVLDALTNYSWPGNIRELQNVLERSVILTSGNVLQVAMPELMGEADAIPFQQASG
jgi:formate hydrogenlyase transcriptional activator